MRASTMIGSQIPSLLSRLNPLWALVRLGDWNSTKEALVSGILAARLNPEATSCCLTVWISGPRSSVTVSLLIVTAPPPLPVRALTSAACAWRLTCTQAVANAALLVILATCEWVKLCTPLATGTAKLWSWAARLGGSPCLARVSTAWLYSALTSTLAKTLAVIRSVRACWMAGSLASGAIVRTYRSVLVTWFLVHTATTDSGASTQASTMSRLARAVRHRCRAARSAAAMGALPDSLCCRSRERRLATSARSRSTSAPSSSLAAGASGISVTIPLPVRRARAPSPVAPDPSSPTLGESLAEPWWVWLGTVGHVCGQATLEGRNDPARSLGRGGHLIPFGGCQYDPSCEIPKAAGDDRRPSQRPGTSASEGIDLWPQSSSVSRTSPRAPRASRLSGRSRNKPASRRTAANSRSLDSATSSGGSAVAGVDRLDDRFQGVRSLERVPMIGVETQRRAWRPGGRRPGHPRHRTVRHHRRPAGATTPPGPVAASGGDRTQAHRCRTGHPGGHASPAGVYLRGPLAAPRQSPPTPPVSLPARAVRLQQAPAPHRRAAAPRDPRHRYRHGAVDRRRVDRGLHPGGVRSLAGDRQALRSGGVGPVRLVRQPLALLLGVAAASGVHPARPADLVRAGWRKGRRTRGAVGPCERRAGTGRRPTGTGAAGR